MEEIKIIGITVRTTNQDQKAAQDIPVLWDKFMWQGLAEKIPNRENEAVYCVYTDYEKDYTAPYTVVLGCRVTSLDEIPEGMAGITFPEEKYEKFVAEGPQTVINEWMKIWNSDLERTYKADFEVYSDKPEVEIFIGVSDRAK